MIQAILFERDRYTPAEALTWLNERGYHPIKEVHITKNFLRYRLAPPKKFKRFYTMTLKDGIELVVGVK